MEHFPCLCEPRFLHLYNGNRKVRVRPVGALCPHCQYQLQFRCYLPGGIIWSEKFLNPKPHIETKLVLGFRYSV